MLPAKNNWFAAVLLLSACGCNLGPQHTAATGTDPFLNDSPKLAEIAPRYSQAGPASTNALHTEAVRPAWVSGAGSQAQPSDRAIVRTMAEVRMTDSVECPCPCPEGGPCPGTASEAYPDEYICDGGDRDLPIHYIDDGMKGLETEDTAVEFRDDEDKRHVRPTNRVCIYAPRFASISTISEPLEDVGGGRPRQAVNAQVGIGLGNREGVFAQHQREGTERLVTRERGSAVKADVVVEAVDQPAIPYTTAHTAVIAEEFSFLRTGLIKQADEVRLATSI
ncbi:MAG: hypothetical protein JSS02_08195, partial [Planctomycetes bacterium]|nr:hypothetical protein [Planctomycetota bacterium]